MNVKDPRTGKEVYLRYSDAYSTDIQAAYATCKHPEPDLRRWTNKNGSVVVQQQCMTCGQRIGSQVKVDDKDSYPPAVEGLYEAWNALVQERVNAVYVKHIDAQEKQDAASRAEYSAYLLTPAWRRKRDKVLKRCKGVCEGCGDSPAAEVHHLTYDHVYNEFLFELVGLCKPCHDRWHGTEPDPLDSEVEYEPQPETYEDPENDLELLLGDDAF